jgi:hypothetical protein
MAGVEGMTDEAIWKKRFHTYALVRLFGVATFLFGVFTAFTDIVRDGGWPLLGGVLAIVGVVDAVFAPRMLKKAWDAQDARK